jgi:hypothetical protein
MFCIDWQLTCLLPDAWALCYQPTKLHIVALFPQRWIYIPGRHKLSLPALQGPRSIDGKLLMLKSKCILGLPRGGLMQSFNRISD